MKCLECSNTTNFSLYTSTLYELQFDEAGNLLYADKDSESFDPESEDISCNDCGSHEIEFTQDEIDTFFSKS